MLLAKIMEADEIQAVRAYHLGRNATRDRMHLAIFRLSCCCGLRQCEIAGLDINDFTMAGPKPYIYVRPEITKGREGKRRPREIPLWWDQGTFSDLEEWRQFRLEQTGGDTRNPYVCSQRKDYLGQRLKPKKVAGHWQRTLYKVLDPERARQITCHYGRHSFITHCLYRRGNLIEARDAAGHANIATTNIYLHAAKQQDKDAQPEDIFG